MIFRLILLFLIIWFLFWIIKKQLSQNNQPSSKITPEAAEDMIACAYCGTHVPKSLGFQSAEKFYCSEDHAKLDESNLNGE